MTNRLHALRTNNRNTNDTANILPWRYTRANVHTVKTDFPIYQTVNFHRMQLALTMRRRRRNDQLSISLDVSRLAELTEVIAFKIAFEGSLYRQATRKRYREFFTIFTKETRSGGKASSMNNTVTENRATVL